jgi:hypothetical protein
MPAGSAALELGLLAGMAAGHKTSTRIWDIADLDRPAHIGSRVAAGAPSALRSRSTASRSRKRWEWAPRAGSCIFQPP